MRILALDQGTTSTRLFAAEGGRFDLVGQLRHETRHPAPERVEQDPDEILRNAARLIAEAGAADALAIANQGESCLAWDAETGAPLSPVIVWQDRRTRGLLAGLAAEGVGDEVAALSGLPLDPYFSASKLGWLLREVPAVAKAAGQGRLRLGTTDAFLLDRLTGRFVTDRATASRTGLMNLATGEWDERLCAIFGVPLHALPEIRPNIGMFGAVGRTPVTAAIVDQQAALWGHGCREPGQSKVTFGTGAFMLAVTGPTPPDPAGLAGLIPTVAWDLGQGPVYAVDGGVQDAGSALEWAIRAGLAERVAEFDGFTAEPAVARGLVFLPAFSGLGAPDWDRSAAPLVIGLAPGMTRRDMVQAILESIAFQAAALVTAADAGPSLSVDGGITKSRYFTRFLARVAGREIVVPSLSERTALGAASLAALALGQSLVTDEALPERIAPAPFPAEWTQRFRDAVARSKGWRA